MRKGLKRGVAGVLLGATLLGTTAFAGIGSFYFEVAPGQGERGTGVWVSRSRSQNYADINVGNFSGVSAYVYVKNKNYNQISDKVNVTGTGHHYAYYQSTVSSGLDYQLYAAPSYSNPHRVTVVQGNWQP